MYCTYNVLYFSSISARLVQNLSLNYIIIPIKFTLVESLLNALEERSVSLSVARLYGNTVGLKFSSSLSSECHPVTKWSEHTRQLVFGSHPFRLMARIHALFFTLFVGNLKNLTTLPFLARLAHPTTQQLFTILDRRIFCHPKVVVRMREVQSCS